MNFNSELRVRDISLSGREWAEQAERGTQSYTEIYMGLRHINSCTQQSP
jgi:hypothetical protein